MDVTRKRPCTPAWDALPPRQQAFVDLYVVQGSAYQAYIGAGYSPRRAETRPQELLETGPIVRAVQERESHPDTLRAQMSLFLHHLLSGRSLAGLEALLEGRKTPEQLLREGISMPPVRKVKTHRGPRSRSIEVCMEDTIKLLDMMATRLGVWDEMARMRQKLSGRLRGAGGMSELERRKATQAEARVQRALAPDPEFLEAERQGETDSGQA